ncbi:MAG: autoinducer 2 ABC transporter substrate-binding protein [Burkholderiaceae bacterium]|nr:autoinducer 2 ABC transporter substrate-binding protein [Burkholderiaceae bacterium]
MRLIVMIGIALACGLAAGALNGPVEPTHFRADVTAKAAGRRFIIATVVKVDGIAWFDRMRKGVEQFGAQTGHDTWMTGPPRADVAAQIEIVENLIAQGVDAICIVPLSVHDIEPALKKARAHGILVVAHEASNIENADYVLEAFDNKAYGVKLMEVLAKAMGGQGPYVATVGSLTAKSQNEWIDGAVEYQKAHYPKMVEVVPRLETHDDANIDYAKLKAVLNAHPDLKGILGGPMPSSAGAGRLISEMKLNGKLFFSGTGLVSVSGQYMRNDAIQYIQFWDPAVAGYAMNIIAVLALEKKAGAIKAGMDLGLPGFTNLIAPDPGRPHLLYGSGWIGVTKADADRYDF